MILRPPMSTPTDTLFPCTTLCRSAPYKGRFYQRVHDVESWDDFRAWYLDEYPCEAVGLHWQESKKMESALHLSNFEIERGVAFLQPTETLIETIAIFFADRLKVQQREAGVRHDLIDAVFAQIGRAHV